MGSERRQYSRSAPGSLVYAQFGKTNGGMVLNASLGGLSFQNVAPTLLHSTVQLTVAPSPEHPIEVAGKVVWIDESGKTGGVEFLNVSPEVQAQIKNWLLPKAAQEKLGPALPTEALGRSLARTADKTGELSSMESARPAAPIFELPASYKRQSQSPRIIASFGATSLLQESAISPEVRKAPNWFLRGLANLTLLGLLLLLPAIYVYNFYPQVAYSLLDRAKALFSGQNASQPEETPAAAGSSPQVTPPDGVPPTEATSGSAAQTATAATSESASSAAPATGAVTKEESKTETAPPAAVPATEPNGAGASSAAPPRVTPSSVAPTKAGPSEAASKVKKPATPPRVVQSEARRIRQTSEPAPTKLPVDPNDPNELWLAVGQGDTDAEVMLARLYLTGRLVKKNCEQGRILLTAASKKGNAEAQSELRSLIRSGCR
jgi:hypothetical protein